MHTSHTETHRHMHQYTDTQMWIYVHNTHIDKNILRFFSQPHRASALRDVKGKVL